MTDFRMYWRQELAGWMWSLSHFRPWVAFMPTRCTMGIRHLRRPADDRCPPPEQFPLAARGGLDASRPKLMDYLKRIHARPAYQKALERGGEYSVLA